MAPGGEQHPCLLPRAAYLAAALSPRVNIAARPAATCAAASAMEATGGSGLTNLLLGPLLQCMEAATLGMPFEARAAAARSRRRRLRA